MGRITLLTSLLLAFGSSPGASDEGVRQLPFRLYPDGDIVVPVTIEGRGPFQFLVDTGSTRTTVAGHLVRHLGLSSVGTTRLLTPSGQALRPLTPLTRLAMGQGPPNTVLAMVAGGEIVAGGRSVDGLIGQDILSRRAFTIDYQRQQLVWHTSAQDERPGERLPLEFREGMLLVSLPQTGAGHTTSGPPTALQLVPDSGADRIVFFARKGRALPRMTAFDSAWLRALSGHRTGTAVRIDELAIGALRLRNQEALLIDLPDPDRRLGDGLLPLHFFARVTFNFPARYLIVEGH